MILIVVDHKQLLSCCIYLFLSTALSNFRLTHFILRLKKVGPGEVDDELQLEEDVVSECGKYRTVTRVIIFEITQPNFPTHEAVRIFVLFSRPEETTKALVAQLDGRFFGGRTVRATFYDELKFSMNELAPVPGEIPG